MAKKLQPKRAMGLSALYPQATQPRAKQAGTGGPSYTTPPQQAQVKRDALKQLVTLLGLGAATGGGARMLMGGGNLFRDTQTPVRGVSLVPPTITIPGSWEDDEREKRGEEKPWWNSGWNWLAQRLPDITTTKPLGDVWGATAGIGAAGAGIAGGWKLTDWLLDRERKFNKSRDLDDAEDEYKKALTDQYRAAMLAKQGADTLGIDDLYDQYADRVKEHGRTKEALFFMIPDKFEKPWELAVGGHDNWRAAKGGLYAAMALLAGGSGKATYDWAKGRGKSKLLDKAMKQRARMRAARSPSPIYTQVGPSPSVIEEEDEPNQLNAT